MSFRKFLPRRAGRSRMPAKGETDKNTNGSKDSLQGKQIDMMNNAK